MSSSRSLKILIVDDSSLYRKIVRQAIERIPGCEVVDIAYDGLSALELMKKHRADLVTLDVEMPRLDGLATLKRIKEEFPKTGVIMLSALTSQGAEITTRALQGGAFDFVLKPSGGSVDTNAAQIASDLTSRIKAFQSSLPQLDVVAPKVTNGFRAPSRSRCDEPVECVCIGVSTGGPQALGIVLPSIPKDLQVPVFIVQHMPPIFTKSLAEHLNTQSKIEVVEAKDMQAIQPRTAYIAPGGRQMKIQKSLTNAVVRVNDDPAEGACRPSVDYLFRSVAECYGGRTLAVILTGMGQDGLVGTRLLFSKGAQVIAQDQATSTVYGMPRQIVDHQLATSVLPISEIGPKIYEIATSRAALCT